MEWIEDGFRSLPVRHVWLEVVGVGAEPRDIFWLRLAWAVAAGCAMMETVMVEDGWRPEAKGQ